jgi:hypothetical protein
VIPVHEFSKAAILGDYSHYVPESPSSLAFNLFDLRSYDLREHFLGPLILSYLSSDIAPRDRDGFVSTTAMVAEMQIWGFLPEQLYNCVRRLTNRKLVETTSRITFEEDLVGLIGDVPDSFRSTSIGLYHIRRWIATFGYIEAMSLDTPIFDEEVREQISSKLESFEIAIRYDRAVLFRNYLSKVWDQSFIRPPYFDWEEALKSGRSPFSNVHFAVQRNARNARNAQAPRRRIPTRPSRR